MTGDNMRQFPYTLVFILLTIFLSYRDNTNYFMQLGTYGWYLGIPFTYGFIEGSIKEIKKDLNK